MSKTQTNQDVTPKAKYLWFDGEFIEWKAASIHPLTHGLNYGSSIFEGERIYNSRIFKSTEHNKRLFNSAKIMKMNLPFSMEKIEEAKKEIVKRNNISYGYMKVLAWRGSEQMNIAGFKCRIHLLIAAWEVGKEFNQQAQSKGLKLCISQWKKPPAETFPHQAKIGGGYVINTLAKHEASEKNYDDALMLDYNNNIAEGSSGNFFGIKDDILYTPTADCFLDGLTRQTIIEIAEQNNIPVKICRIKLEELKNFEETFLTGSAASISPVIQIEDFAYKIGPLTKKLIELYQKTTEMYF